MPTEKDLGPGAKLIVSVVIGSYNRHRFLKLAIESVREELERAALSTEIIVVDGGSTDGTLNWLLKQKDVLTIVQHNRGEWAGRPVERRSWGYFMNLGFRCAQGTYICMLSDDCLVVPGAIGNGVELFESALNAGENIGAVAFYWRDWPEEKEYRVGYTYGNRLHINHGLFLRDALAKIGFADEHDYTFYHADSDMSLRLWSQGYVCLASPNSFVEHYSHANAAIRSSNLSTQKSDWNTYVERWHHLSEPDQDWHYIKHDDPYQTVDKFRRYTYSDYAKNAIKVLYSCIKNKYAPSPEATDLSVTDHYLITELKGKFIHNKREFIHGVKKHVVDCLYCHAVPGTLETCLIKIHEIKNNNREVATLLNLGGGVGQVPDILSNLNLEVVNLDIAVESVDNNNYCFDLNSNSTLSLDGKKFDIIICQEVIEHLENPWLLFRHISNVIKHGGFLIITTPNIQSRHSKQIFNTSGYYRWFTKDCLSYHINPVSLWELELIANKSRFNIIEINGNGDYFFGRNSEKTFDDNECLVFVMRYQGAGI